MRKSISLKGSRAHFGTREIARGTRHVGGEGGEGVEAEHERYFVSAVKGFQSHFFQYLARDDVL